MDWIDFFNQYSVEYVTKGPNVSKGNVNIRCPYCGHEDTSHHMGVSLDGKGWGCWRNREHRGKSPVRLIQSLAGVTKEQAMQIAGYGNFPSDYDRRMKELTSAPSEIPQRGLRLPSEFKAFDGKPSARMFEQYLKQRGFSEDHIKTLTKRYGVRYCTKGAFSNRIIFPVRFESQIVSWTGRTISKGDMIRYKTLSTNPEKSKSDGYPLALGGIGEYLLWFDKLLKTRAKTICLVEGPFDALKVSVLGKDLGICATCFFTSSPSESQIDLLHELLPRFKDKVIIPDRGAFDKAMVTQQRLASLNVRVLHLPSNVDDPGDLDGENLRKIFC